MDFRLASQSMTDVCTVRIGHEHKRNQASRGKNNFEGHRIGSDRRERQQRELSFLGVPPSAYHPFTVLPGEHLIELSYQRLFATMNFATHVPKPT